VSMASETITLGFIGKTGSVETMAGVGIAIVYINVTLSAMVQGMNYGLSVLVPIAYG
jgi:Na+-driven multidrug efflux pump